MEDHHVRLMTAGLAHQRVLLLPENILFVKQMRSWVNLPSGFWPNHMSPLLTPVVFGIPKLRNRCRRSYNAVRTERAVARVVTVIV